jgi:hypothetical protein
VSALVQLAGHSAFEAAALAAVKLSGVVWLGNESLIESCRDAMIASLERLQEAGLDAPWFRWRLGSLCNDETWRADWTEESAELIRHLGELMALDEALDASHVAAPAIRDGQPAVLASGAPAPFEAVTWTCFGRYHSDCPGESAALGDCLCACHGAATAPASRPASPPPPSGDGDEEAEELSAARAATGDTLPPASGDVDLPEMACCTGADTEPPAPGETQWFDDVPTVRF